MKKGQVTLFVLIGLIIIVLVGLGLYFRSTLIEKEPELLLPAEVQEFHDLVSSCIDEVAKENLVVIGLQGGYDVLPEESLILEPEDEEDEDVDLYLPYYYDKGENLMPEEEMVTTEVATAIDNEAELCIDKEAFPKLEIEEELPETEVSLEDGSVKVSTSYPITVTSGEQTFYLSRPYEFAYPVNLKKILNTANQIIAKKIENPEELDLEFMLEFEMEIDIMPLDNNTEVYSITDPQSILDEEQYLFMFANRLEE